MALFPSFWSHKVNKRFSVVHSILVLQVKQKKHTDDHKFKFKKKCLVFTPLISETRLLIRSGPTRIKFVQRVSILSTRWLSGAWCIAATTSSVTPEIRLILHIRLARPDVTGSGVRFVLFRRGFVLFFASHLTQRVVVVGGTGLEILFVCRLLKIILASLMIVETLSARLSAGIHVARGIVGLLGVGSSSRVLSAVVCIQS